MWVWVTVVGLVVEVGMIVALGRAATRGSERDQPPRPVPRPAPARVRRPVTHGTVPLTALPAPPVTAAAAVRQAARRGAPAARR